ncbi:MAG: precorrin-2 C(20)-methyltransferase [Reinekea sp.]
MTGKFIGVGVGPGDPELITLKAARCIEQADIISYIANEQGYSQGRAIASGLLAAPEVTEELPVIINMFSGRDHANNAYDQAATRIQQAVSAGKKVVFLCEGDPLFFGSFGYLLERLSTVISCQVVPGISSVNAAASALQIPLTLLRESFAVVSGRHDEATLVDVLNRHDTVVIMKAGRQRQTILKAIARAGRNDDAHYLENISRADEYIETPINGLAEESGPYFSMFVVIRKQRDRS